LPNSRRRSGGAANQAAALRDVGVEGLIAQPMN